MIIEIIGLPGSGKTTLTEAMKAHGAVLIPMPSRVLLVLEAFLFWFLHPLLALTLFWYIAARAPRTVRYELMVNGYLGYAARYRRAKALSRAGATTVLDQGFFQLLISLGKLPPTLLELFPKPDLLAIVEADVSMREKRMKLRGWVPREELGIENRLAWQRSAETTLRDTLPSLEKLVRVYRYDGTQDPQEGSTVLMALAAKQSRTTTQISSTRNLLKTVLATVSFLVAQVARIFQSTPQVVVLMYHAVDNSGWKLSVSPETFERQMKYLARKGWAVPLADVVLYAKGEKKLSAHAVAVTFDDGYRDLLTMVLPIITKYKIPITIFVPSDVSIRSGERAKRDICTWEELRILQRTGLVSIESHSRTHAHPSRLSPRELAEEMKGSADDIERELGVRSRYHAYPYGERSPEIEAEATKTYTAAFGITEGTIHQGDDLFRLKRVQVDGTMSFFLFRLRLTSAVDWNRRIVDSMRAMMPI